MTAALRRTARAGMLAGLTPAKIALRVVRMSDEGINVAGTEQLLRDIIDLLGKSEARQYLRVSDRAAFDDHPQRLIGMGWLTAGAKRRREIRNALEADRDAALCVTVLLTPTGFAYEFSVVPHGAPVTFSEDMIALAGLALLPAKGEA